MRFLQRHKYVLFTCLVFGIIYLLISFVNHYTFQTYALDLGLYTNALYDYIHFQWNDSSLFLEVENNLLADHFDLYLIIFSPLSLVFGTYTLLVVQIISILSGGIGVYVFFYSLKRQKLMALFATLFFYLFFGVFNAVAYDYHSNVVAATLIPWLLYFVAKRQLLASSLFILLIIVAKENMALWLAFVLLGLAIEHRMDKKLRNFLLVATVFSVVNFLSITNVIMPAISTEGIYPHFNYSFLGDNMLEAIVYLISHPVESIKVLFTNHNNSAHGDFVKVETHILLLASGVAFLIKKPHYLLMLIPIYFQKFYNDHYFIWSFGGQYNIEFVPILAIGIFSVISEFENRKLQLITSSVLLFFVMASTIRTMDKTAVYNAKSRIAFYQKRHYQREYNIHSAHHQLAMIPADAVVSAQSPFVPHLALREEIYHFPIIKNADYIVYSRMESFYPLTEEEGELKVSQLENSRDWEVIYDDGITILKKTEI